MPISPEIIKKIICLKFIFFIFLWVHWKKRFLKPTYIHKAQIIQFIDWEPKRNFYRAKVILLSFQNFIHGVFKKQFFNDKKFKFLFSKKVFSLKKFSHFAWKHKDF